MSDRTYAKTQAQQKTLIGSSPGGHLLQRTCAYGQHTIAGAQCPTCCSNQSTLLRSQSTLGSPSTSTFPRENAASVNSGSGGVSHFSHDFSQIPIHSTTQVAPGVLSTEEYDVQLGVPVHRVPTSSLMMDVVQRAATDNSRSLDESVREPLEQNLGHNFSQVRVHYGPASSLAAEHLGARAYTLGSNIYLGKEAQQLSRLQYNRLLAHEAIHTVQQGGRPVAPQAKLEVSRPTDAAEIEADHLAESIISSAERPASCALARRDQLQVTPATPSTVSQVVAPLIQRDLRGLYGVEDGTFILNLKKESHPGEESGMSGTIKFKASPKAPDSKSIRLLQVVRVEDLTTNKEFEWWGEEANRNKIMTAGNKAKKIEPGYFVDHSAAAASPRTKKGDAPVSPYYRDYFPNPRSSQDGSKHGKTVEEASLWDYPGFSDKSRFSFETAAKAADTGYIYGTVRWGFTISDGARGKVEKEHVTVHSEPSKTFGAAVKKFNEFYKNPGASTAPK